MAEEYDRMEVDEEVDDQQQDDEDEEAFEAADDEAEEEEQQDEESRDSDEIAEVCQSAKPPSAATATVGCVWLELTLECATCRRMPSRLPSQRSSA